MSRGRGRRPLRGPRPGPSPAPPAPPDPRPAPAPAPGVAPGRGRAPAARRRARPAAATGPSRAVRLRRLLVLDEDPAALVAAAPPVPVRAIVRRFWPYARPYRGTLLVVLALAALGPVIDAAMVWMFKVVVDDVLVPQRLRPVRVGGRGLPGARAAGRRGLVRRRLPAHLGEPSASCCACAPTSSATCTGSRRASTTGGAWGTRCRASPATWPRSRASCSRAWSTPSRRSCGWPSSGRCCSCCRGGWRWRRSWWRRCSGWPRGTSRA